MQGNHADRGRGWPDAVSVSGLAAFLEQPILLVEHNRVPGATARAIASLELEGVTIVGGEDVVSTGVEDALDVAVEAVDRLAGTTRYGTSAAVAEASIGVGMQLDRALLATGTAFADALVAGPVAAATGSVLLLVDADPVTVEPTVALLASRKSTVSDVVVVGGPQAVSTLVEASIGSSVE